MNHSHAQQMPSPWMKRWAPLVRPGGVVLDLACGQGRHARLFAGRGHPVLAVDRDATALDSLRHIEGIDTRLADLEGEAWPFAAQHFAAVVVANYLHRPLLPALVAALEPDGVLIYETFMQGNERYGRPSSPAFLLRPAELLECVAGHLTVVAFEQGVLETPRPAVVQRICATRRAAPSHIL